MSTATRQTTNFRSRPRPLRRSGKAKAIPVNYSSPQWINLKNGAAMKRAFISRDNE